MYIDQLNTAKKFLLTFIISLMRENLSKIFFTSLDRIYLLWRVTRVDRDIWNHKILHELLNLISLINDGSRLLFFHIWPPFTHKFPPPRFLISCKIPTSLWFYVQFLHHVPTVAINDLLCMKNAGAQIAMDFS